MKNQRCEQAPFSEAGTLQGKSRRRQRVTYTRLVTKLAQYGVKRLSVSCRGGQAHSDVSCMSGTCKRWSFRREGEDPFAISQKAAHVRAVCPHSAIGQLGSNG